MNDFKEYLNETKRYLGINSDELPQEFYDSLKEFKELIGPTFLKQISKLVQDFDKLTKWEKDVPFKSHNGKDVKNYKEINKFDRLKNFLIQIQSDLNNYK